MATPKIYAGNYGHTHTITLVDEDDAALDISGATTKQIVFKDPSGNETSVTAEYVTDGTDGKITYTVTSADEIDDEAGVWTKWALVISTSAVYRYASTPESYRVFSPGQE